MSSVEFEEIAHSEGAKVIYQRVVDSIKLPEHPEFLKRPIKVLDLCGGAGVVGSLLKSQCESDFGPVSEADFATLVDYVNLDRNRGALEKSVGRATWGFVNECYSRFCDEEPFDFVLSINPSPAVHQYTPQELDRIGVPDDFNPIRGILLDSAERFSGYQARITLITAVLLMSREENSRYILAGFIGKDSFEGTMRFIRENYLGLKVESDQRVNLDETTKSLFAVVDTGKKHAKSRRLRTDYDLYRVVTMRPKGKIDKPKVVTLLNDEIEGDRELAGWCEAQERFGSW